MLGLSGSGSLNSGTSSMVFNRGTMVTRSGKWRGWTFMVGPVAASQRVRDMLQTGI